jgi:hypothetical protein
MSFEQLTHQRHTNFLVLTALFVTNTAIQIVK